MSRKVVRYEGEGKHRRPVYSDPLTADMSINPPGPVERRLATDDERSGFAPRIPSNRLTVAPRRPPSRVAGAEDLTPPQRTLVTALVNAERADRGESPIRLAEPPEEQLAMQPSRLGLLPQRPALGGLVSSVAESPERRGVRIDRRRGILDNGRGQGGVGLHYVGKKGLLPLDLIAKLPGRYAKYKPAGV